MYKRACVSVCVCDTAEITRAVRHKKGDRGMNVSMKESLDLSETYDTHSLIVNCTILSRMQSMP